MGGKFPKVIARAWRGEKGTGAHPVPARALREYGGKIQKEGVSAWKNLAC